MMRLTLTLAALTTLASAQEREPLPQVDPVAPPVPVPDWHERDAEGRWHLIEQHVGDEPGAIERWIPFLIDQRDDQQLEWIVTAHSLGTASAIRGLVAADAPGWLRAAEWRLVSLESHSVGGAKIEIEKHPAVFVAWVERHSTSVSGVARALRRSILSKNPGLVYPDPEVIDRYAAPWTDEQLYGVLAGADRARPLGDRHRAEPGALYEEQVLRSMRTLANAGRRTPESCAALLAVALGGNERLGLAATRAFSQFSQNDIPYAALIEASGDPTLSPARREGAFLAATFATPAVVFVDLHDAVSNPDHAHWTAALSRLVDLGNGFSVEHLRRVAASPLLSKAQSALLDLQAATLAKRTEVEEKAMAGHAQRWLEFSAYADLRCASIEHDLRTWTLETLRTGLDQKGLREVLASIEKSYRFLGVAPDVLSPIDDRVKAYARQLLE